MTSYCLVYELLRFLITNCMLMCWHGVTLVLVSTCMMALSRPTGLSATGYCVLGLWNQQSLNNCSVFAESSFKVKYVSGISLMAYQTGMRGGAVAAFVLWQMCVLVCVFVCVCWEHICRVYTSCFQAGSLTCNDIVHSLSEHLHLTMRCLRPDGSPLHPWQRQIELKCQ